MRISQHERAANIFWFVLIVGPFVGGLCLLVWSLGFAAFQGPANFNILDVVRLSIGMGVIGGLIPCFISAILCYGWVMWRGSFSYLAAAFIGLVATCLFIFFPAALSEMPALDWQTLFYILKAPVWFALPSALATRWLIGRWQLLA